MSCVNHVSCALIWGDRICDYIPGVSMVTNLIEIFIKCVLDFCSTKKIESSRCFSHINDKNDVRCVVLLVPILGNVIIGIYDVVESLRKKRRLKHLELSSQADFLGVDISQLPKKASERHRVIEAKRQEEMRKAKQAFEKSLDLQISSMPQAIEKFRKIIENPDEPLELAILGIRGCCVQGTHREKIDYYWSSAKVMFSIQNLQNKFLDPKEFSQKLQKMAEFKKELWLLRQTSYSDWIKKIEPDELLQEAKKYYLSSFSIEKQESIENSLEAMTLTTILPQMKKNALDSAKDDCNVVEMHAIISQIENMS